jgi:His-Xaa-Ser system radical SAM maturase HxsC
MVTGASGLIGSAITARLISAGHNVFGLARNAKEEARRWTDAEKADHPHELRAQEAYLGTTGELPRGFGIYLTIKRNASALQGLPQGAPIVILPDVFDYIKHGDVLRVRPKSRDVRVLYRRNSPHNSFLVTERCHHYCLMCSQPPRDVDDRWIVDEIMAVIPLIDPATREIGLTGGEPTLLGEGLLRILRMMKSYLPHTSIHILSNGRMFANMKFAQQYADIQHPDIMIGIPVYSDASTIHDYVVQADGAFDETLRGILNLKRLAQKVEIRIVIHRQTFARLPQLAEFIARNLTFVDHVALMGLEITGFTRANLDQLWIDPVDYQPQLYHAATLLEDHRIRVSIYNHQLCVLDRRIWHLARKSISDWKNEYIPECVSCKERVGCGGFFASAKFRRSDQIKAFV